MRRVTKLVAVVAAATFALAACGGGSDDDSSTDAGGSSATSDVKVGLAYDVGGRGDQSFNDSAATGLDKAKSEFGVEAKELEASTGETDTQREERLRLLAQGGYNPVIAVGYAYATALGNVAKEFPDTQFAIIDDSTLADTANVTSLVFAEEQGSYLVGAIAAEASKTGSIGYIGGVNTPLLQKFEAGFTQGAEAVNKDIKVQVKYLSQPPDYSGFGAPDKAETTAQGMIDADADVIYAAAGGSGSGVFKAVKAAGADHWAIGVDSDQYLTAGDDVKDVILTSMLKRVDTSVYDFVKSAVDGKVLTGVQEFDLSDEGIDYSTSNSAVESYEAKADELKKQIIDGDITVSDKP
ncbi:BMP family ABC transporter substrate-binding protein [Kineosporia sp. J2-2]|uniref:BMP family ABC transporter substrate-binding protein n=1 Tax=Kineosporia corallincola TaxID=2835133 RepID=A0ABS5TA85_9ACTN|nr:BMP family ABC transporter substrate-binding protein [Kineosporia corallincola]MBT0767971.1 BMP family ABC transporter substrate-binding protein [Kineosporia corallincola]